MFGYFLIQEDDTADDDDDDAFVTMSVDSLLFNGLILVALNKQSRFVLMITLFFFLLPHPVVPKRTDVKTNTLKNFFIKTLFKLFFNFNTILYQNVD